MKNQSSNLAKVVGINSKFDEQGKILPIKDEKSKAEVTYLEEQMPIKVFDNTIEVELSSGMKIRRDKAGRIISRRELTPEEKAKIAKEMKIQEDIEH